MGGSIFTEEPKPGSVLHRLDAHEDLSPLLEPKTLDFEAILTAWVGCMLIATFIHISSLSWQVLSGNQDIPDSEDAGNTKSKGKMEPYQDVETPMECEQDKGVVPPKGHVIGPVPTPVRANAAPAAPSQSSDTTPKAVRKGKSKAKAKATPKKGKNQHGKKPPKASRDVSRKLAAKKIYKKKGKDDVERKLHSVAKLVMLHHIEAMSFMFAQTHFTKKCHWLSCFAKVYSGAHKIAKTRGFSAEESKTRAIEARWQWPGIAIWMKRICSFHIWVVVCLVGLN